jgi:hypothetical protein
VVHPSPCAGGPAPRAPSDSLARKTQTRRIEGDHSAFLSVIFLQFPRTTGVGVSVCGLAGLRFCSALLTEIVVVQGMWPDPVGRRLAAAQLEGNAEWQDLLSDSKQGLTLIPETMA